MNPTVNYYFSHVFMRDLVFTNPEVLLSAYYKESGYLQGLLHQTWKMAASPINPEGQKEGFAFGEMWVRFNISMNDLFETLVIVKSGSEAKPTIKKGDITLLRIDINQLEKLKRTDCKSLCIVINEVEKKLEGYFTCEYGRGDDGKMGYFLGSWKNDRHSNYGFISLSLPDDVLSDKTAFDFLSKISELSYQNCLSLKTPK